MDVSPAKRSYFTCANVWWKLLFHSTETIAQMADEMIIIEDGKAVRR